MLTQYSNVSYAVSSLPFLGRALEQYPKRPEVPLRMHQSFDPPDRDVSRVLTKRGPLSKELSDEIRGPGRVSAE